jgi:hypothetical protein
MKRFLEDTNDKIWLDKEDAEDAEEHTSRDAHLKAVIDMVDRLGLSSEKKKDEAEK